MPSEITLCTQPPQIRLERGMVVFTYQSGREVALFPHDAMLIIKGIRDAVSGLNDEGATPLKLAS